MQGSYIICSVKNTSMNRQPYFYNSNMSYRPSPPRRAPKKHHSFLRFVILILVIIGVIVFGYNRLSAKPSAQQSSIASSTPGLTSTNSSSSTTKNMTNYCANNTLSQLIRVNISKQHLWACSGSTTVYNSPVITGMERYNADKTPIGTYHIFTKQTNLALKGCDTTGCWDDPVSYWMGWLSNQYGQYGFHDATWRKPSEFGNVNIYAPYTASVIGSHGCVELPIATARWIYNWSVVGTTVSIES